MTTTALTGHPTRRGRLGRFTLHFFEMCAPMCVGFAIGELFVIRHRSDATPSRVWFSGGPPDHEAHPEPASPDRARPQERWPRSG